MISIIVIAALSHMTGEGVCHLSLDGHTLSSSLHHFMKVYMHHRQGRTVILSYCHAIILSCCNVVSHMFSVKCCHTFMLPCAHTSVLSFCYTPTFHTPCCRTAIGFTYSPQGHKTLHMFMDDLHLPQYSETTPPSCHEVSDSHSLTVNSR